MKKELITLTAIAATGLATTVSANEVAEPNVDNAGGVRTAQTEPAFNITDAKNEPALVEKEAPKQVEVKTPTKEKVTELGATVKQTQEDADKAKEVLDRANETSDRAEKKVADLKQAQDDAQALADKATPEVIENAEKKVETAKEKVPTAEQGVSSAQTTQDDADRNVAIQGKTVGTKQAEVTQAQNGVADAKEKQVETKTRQITSGIVISDVKAKIEKSLNDSSKLNQEELDRLTYYLYQYTQSGYQFLGANGNNSNIGMQAFVDLKKLYEQSGLKAPYDYNVETDEITFNRDVQKPKDYNQKIDEVKDAPKEKAEKVVDSKDGSVKLESEGIIE